MSSTVILWSIAILIALSNLLYTMLSNRRKADSDKVGKIYERLDDHETRLIKIESSVDGLPSKDFAHRLELQLIKLEGEIGVLSERIKPVAAMSDRMQEYMMERERV